MTTNNSQISENVINNNSNIEVMKTERWRPKTQ